jgi:hypothetical protein
MPRTWLAPPGNARRLQMTLFWLIVLAGIGVTAGWVASRFGLVGWDLAWVGLASAFVAEMALFFVPVRISSELTSIFAGPPELLFQLASDIKLSLQVSGNPRRVKLVKEIGKPGELGSSYVMRASGVVTTTTVVSSDPPRQLVTISKSRLNRVDVSRTYTTVPGGTRVDMRARHRMPLAAWLLRPVFRPELQATMTQAQDRLTEYLRSVAASPTTSD